MKAGYSRNKTKETKHMKPFIPSAHDNIVSLITTLDAYAASGTLFPEKVVQSSLRAIATAYGTAVSKRQVTPADTQEVLQYLHEKVKATRLRMQDKVRDAAVAAALAQMSSFDWSGADEAEAETTEETPA
jgi:hypothetical protein